MAAKKEPIIVEEIEDLALRSVFTREDSDFTPWLAEDDNLKRLARILGFDLELLETEASTGTFRTDILARRTQDDAIVVIENQFGRSDHDHFGKSMTYLSAHDASVVVWIAESFADEHRSSLAWLNDHTDDEFEFWGIIPRLLRIGNSAPGLRFEVAVAPNRLVKRTHKTDRRMDESVSVTRQAFWKIFTDLVNTDPVLSKCETRYGGRLGFVWFFPEDTGNLNGSSPHILVFITAGREAGLGYGVYTKKGADEADTARTDTAFLAAMQRLRDAKIAPGEVRGKYARLFSDLNNEVSMRDLADQAIARIRVVMLVLSETLRADAQPSP